MMDIMDREDVSQQVELSKVIDMDDIPFEKLMNIVVRFICDELITHGNMEKLEINEETRGTLREYAELGESFFNGLTSKDMLKKSAASAWEIYKSLEAGSAYRHLIRIVICCLCDEEDVDFDTYGSEAMLSVFFSLLFDLGGGYCTKFRHYIQDNFSG